MSTEWDRRTLLELASGFQRSRIILSAAELNIFEILSSGEMGAIEVAGRLKGDPRGVRVLLDALAALEILRKKEGRYSLPEELVPLLTSTPVESSILPMLRHSAALWEGWSGLTEIVRNGYVEPPGEEEDGHQKDFIGAMHAIGTALADSIAAKLPLGGSRRLLDLGGGSGIYTIAFLRANPHLQGVLFDHPEVVGLARGFLEREGLLDRVELAEGDLFYDELPGGCDAALLSAIIHSYSPDQNRELFRRIYAALVPSGMLIIRDHLMEPDHVRPVDGALFAVNMLVRTSGGGTYSFDEVRTWLAEAGFTGISLIPGRGIMDDLVIGKKPGE